MQQNTLRRLDLAEALLDGNRGEMVSIQDL